MREILERALPECGAGLRLDGLKTQSVRYEPGRRCTLLYSARFGRPLGGRGTSWPLAAVVLPEGRRPPNPPARRQTPRDAPLTTTVVRLPEAGIAVYPYPVDPKLRELARACDPVAIRAELGAAWKDHGVRPRRVGVERLGYTPFARAALGFEILGERRRGGLPEIRRLVGKLDVDRSAQHLFARSLAMWRAARGRIELVPPVGYLPSLGLFLQERLEGTRLADLATGARLAKRARQVAHAAATLHGLELPLRSRRGPSREAATVHRWGGLLSAIRPDSAPRVRRLCDRIAADLENRVSITGPVHADLHPANLLVSGERLVLIDLDNAALGDRLLDVGRFLAALRTTSFRVHGRADGLAEAEEAFLAKYLELSGEDESRARLFEAACLITSAVTGFRLQRQDWQRSADALIEEAEGALDRSRRRLPARPDVPAASVRPGLKVRSVWAADAEYVKAMLDEKIRERYQAEITRCRVQRRREHSGTLRFRYRLTGVRNGAPWNATLEGILRHRGRGHGPAVRLSAVAFALASSGTGLLPEPVTFLSEIGMLVVEVPPGIPLASLLSETAGTVAVERLAGDVARLHEVDTDLDRSRSHEEEVLALGRAVEKLNGQRSRFTRVYRRIADRITSLPQLRSPVLRKLSPDRILCHDDYVTVAEVDDVVLSHPCLDAGDFLARLRLVKCPEEGGASIAAARDRFRAAYLQYRPEAREALRGFEAAALLRLACVEARLRPESGLSRSLLAAAEERSS
jgi:thiamine kinase-like enzyme